jgi:hypothetical protein
MVNNKKEPVVKLVDDKTKRSIIVERARRVKELEGVK